MLLKPGDRVVLLNNIGEIEPCGRRNVEAYEGEFGTILEIFKATVHKSITYYVKFKYNTCEVYPIQVEKVH